MKNQALRQQLKDLAAMGLTQSEAARITGISRARVSQLAIEMRVAFVRKGAKGKVALICPTCGKARITTPAKLKSHRTTYCYDHRAEAKRSLK